jgi:osmotically-inducible protein OsmY
VRRSKQSSASTRSSIQRTSPQEHQRGRVADDSDVGVYTSGNTVTLTGHVSTWAEHDAVVGAAWMARGVSDVRDDLDITG